MQRGDFNMMGPTGSQAGASEPERMLDEADRLRHTHPGGERRPGIWQRIRAELTRRR